MNTFYRRYGKRGFDLGVATVTFMAALPIMSAVGIAVRVSLGSPVFFRQRRIGWRGRPFTMVKFRTLAQTRDASGALLSDEARMTRLGAWLRRTSLDELPELWNVIRGEMSLVGPRPLLPEYLPLYSARQRRRHEVRPGMTGWAQVRGRNAISWDQQFEVDVRYVEAHDLGLDVKILGQTVLQAALQRGVSAPGAATRPKFTGASSVGSGLVDF